MAINYPVTTHKNSLTKQLQNLNVYTLAYVHMYSTYLFVSNNMKKEYSHTL